MKIDETKLIANIVHSEGWKLIDAIIEAHIQKLKSIDSIDVSVNAQSLKLTVESRQKAAEILSNILRDVRGYGAQQPMESPLTRSMR